MKLIVTFFLSLFSLALIGQNEESIRLINFEKEIRKNTTAVADEVFIAAESDCDGTVEITYEDGRFSGGCAGVLQRTYTLKDDCGNSREVIQFIALEDNTPPVFQNQPEDVTINSRSDLEGPITMVAFDESGTDVTITVEESYDMEGKNAVKVIRTWTATDICDNQATYTRVITIPRRTQMGDRVDR